VSPGGWRLLHAGRQTEIMLSADKPGVKGIVRFAALHGAPRPGKVLAMNIRIVKTDSPRSEPAVVALRERLRAGGLVGGAAPAVDVRKVVEEIIQGVRQGGDSYLIEHTREIHNVRLSKDQLAVSPDEIDKARAEYAKADADFLPLMRKVIGNIRQYQKHILMESPPPLRRGGRELGVRYAPLDRVAVYVPGGRAVYPSSLLMTAVPAQVAGVGQIAMVSPPTTDGDIHPMILALAGELGIGEVYRVAGVAGLAAAAFGTESIRPVDMIAGPGSAFITEAKRQLFGRVGIDSVAGPSEVLIVADATARAEWVAADLLAQAEHDPGSAVLVTDSETLAREVAAAIESQLPALERKEAIAAALREYSLIVVVGDLEAACELANEFASEHVQIITADEQAALRKIRNAGAIFIGPHSPVPLGDYYAGPSHVLPTGGTARFFSPLSANDFRKATSLLRYDAAALTEDAQDVIEFARREGLTAHARAVEIRKEGK